MDTKQQRLERRVRHILLPYEKLQKRGEQYQLVDRRNDFVIDSDVDLDRLYRETKIYRTLGPNDPVPDSLNLSPEELARELAKS
jgi:hypothetical protein